MPNHKTETTLELKALIKIFNLIEHLPDNKWKTLNKAVNEDIISIAERALFPKARKL